MVHLNIHFKSLLKAPNGDAGPGTVAGPSSPKKERFRKALPHSSSSSTTKKPSPPSSINTSGPTPTSSPPSYDTASSVTDSRSSTDSRRSSTTTTPSGRPESGLATTAAMLAAANTAPASQPIGRYGRDQIIRTHVLDYRSEPGQPQVIADPEDCLV